VHHRHHLLLTGDHLLRVAEPAGLRDLVHLLEVLHGVVCRSGTGSGRSGVSELPALLSHGPARHHPAVSVVVESTLVPDLLVVVVSVVVVSSALLTSKPVLFEVTAVALLLLLLLLVLRLALESSASVRARIPPSARLQRGLQQP
jgi:hypothetical protein